MDSRRRGGRRSLDDSFGGGGGMSGRPNGRNLSLDPSELLGMSSFSSPEMPTGTNPKRRETIDASDLTGLTFELMGGGEESLPARRAGSLGDSTSRHLTSWSASASASSAPSKTKETMTTAITKMTTEIIPEGKSSLSMEGTQGVIPSNSFLDSTHEEESHEVSSSHIVTKKKKTTMVMVTEETETALVKDNRRETIDPTNMLALLDAEDSTVFPLPGASRSITNRRETMDVADVDSLFDSLDELPDVHRKKRRETVDSADLQSLLGGGDSEVSNKDQIQGVDEVPLPFRNRRGGSTPNLRSSNLGGPSSTSADTGRDFRRSKRRDTIDSTDLLGLFDASMGDTSAAHITTISAPVMSTVLDSSPKPLHVLQKTSPISPKQPVVSVDPVAMELSDDPPKIVDYMEVAKASDSVLGADDEASNGPPQSAAIGEASELSDITFGSVHADGDGETSFFAGGLSPSQPISGSGVSVIVENPKRPIGGGVESPKEGVSLLESSGDSGDSIATADLLRDVGATLQQDAPHFASTTAAVNSSSLATDSSSASVGLPEYSSPERADDRSNQASPGNETVGTIDLMNAVADTLDKAPADAASAVPASVLAVVTATTGPIIEDMPSADESSLSLAPLADILRAVGAEFGKPTPEIIGGVPQTEFVDSGISLSQKDESVEIPTQKDESVEIPTQKDESVEIPTQKDESVEIPTQKDESIDEITPESLVQVYNSSPASSSKAAPIEIYQSPPGATVDPSAHSAIFNSPQAAATTKVAPPSALKNSLRSRSTKDSVRTVAFGSPGVAEFDLDAPTTSFTPLPRDDAIKHVSGRVGGGGLFNNSPDPPTPDAVTLENDQILNEFSRLANPHDEDFSLMDSDEELQMKMASARFSANPRRNSFSRRRLSTRLPAAILDEDSMDTDDSKSNEATGAAPHTENVALSNYLIEDSYTAPLAENLAEFIAQSERSIERIDAKSSTSKNSYDDTEATEDIEDNLRSLMNHIAPSMALGSTGLFGGVPSSPESSTPAALRYAMSPGGVDVSGSSLAVLMPSLVAGSPGRQTLEDVSVQNDFAEVDTAEKAKSEPVIDTNSVDDGMSSSKTTTENAPSSPPKLTSTETSLPVANSPVNQSPRSPLPTTRSADVSSARIAWETPNREWNTPAGTTSATTSATINPSIACGELLATLRALNAGARQNSLAQCSTPGGTRVTADIRRMSLLATAAAKTINHPVNNDSIQDCAIATTTSSATLTTPAVASSSAANAILSSWKSPAMLSALASDASFVSATTVSLNSSAPIAATAAATAAAEWLCLPRSVGGVLAVGDRANQDLTGALAAAATDDDKRTGTTEDSMLSTAETVPEQPEEEDAAVVESVAISFVAGLGAPAVIPSSSTVGPVTPAIKTTEDTLNAAALLLPSPGAVAAAAYVSAVAERTRALLASDLLRFVAAATAITRILSPYCERLQATARAVLRETLKNAAAQSTLRCVPPAILSSVWLPAAQCAAALSASAASASIQAAAAASARDSFIRSAQKEAAVDGVDGSLGRHDSWDQCWLDSAVATLSELANQYAHNESAMQGSALDLLRSPPEEIPVAPAVAAGVAGAALPPPTVPLTPANRRALRSTQRQLNSTKTAVEMANRLTSLRLMEINASRIAVSVCLSDTQSVQLVYSLSRNGTSVSVSDVDVNLETTVPFSRKRSQFCDTTKAISAAFFSSVLCAPGGPLFAESLATLNNPSQIIQHIRKVMGYAAYLTLSLTSTERLTSSDTTNIQLLRKEDSKVYVQLIVNDNTIEIPLAQFLSVSAANTSNNLDRWLSTLSNTSYTETTSQRHHLRH